MPRKRQQSGAGPLYSNKISCPNLSVPKMSSEKDQKLMAESKNLCLQERSEVGNSLEGRKIESALVRKGCS